jgi:DNA-binding NarL/FixJ family response regulator
MRRRQSFATILVGRSVLLREGIARILRAANFRILGSVSSSNDLLPAEIQQQQLLFLFVHNGDDFDSTIGQIEVFQEQYPNGRIAIVADHYRLSEVVLAFRAGASGYFVDVMTCDAFIKSLQLVMMGGTVFPPAFLSFARDPASNAPSKTEVREDDRAILLAADESTVPQLSPREKSILRCLIEGDTNKCIARKINIAEATVKVHVKAILRKIRVQNRTQAAIWAMNNDSLTRSSGNDPSSDAPKRHPDAASVISELKQIEATSPGGISDHEPNHVEVPSINRLLRKGINRKSVGLARFGK